MMTTTTTGAKKEDEEEKIVPGTTAGTILFSGCTDFKNAGRTKQIDESVFANVCVPSKISTFEEEEGLEFTFVAAGAAAAHNVAIDTKGRLWAWGRNENGQLGTGDKHNRNAPQIVKGINFGENGDGEDKDAVKIVWAACGRNHTICVDSEGSFYGCGSNKSGQLGVPIVWSRQKKNVDDERVEFVKSASATHAKFVKATCGIDFTVLTDENGKMWSFGCPQYGQLGHGDDHEYNMKEGTVKLAYEPQPTPKMIRSGDLNPENDYKVVTTPRLWYLPGALDRFTCRCGALGHLVFVVLLGERNIVGTILCVTRCNASALLGSNKIQRAERGQRPGCRTGRNDTLMPCVNAHDACCPFSNVRPITQ